MTDDRSIPHTAQRARAVALERHRAELEEVRSEADRKLALLNDMLASERDLKEEAARSTMDFRSSVISNWAVMSREVWYRAFVSSKRCFVSLKSCAFAIAMAS